MTAILARWSLLALAIALLAVWLPLGKDLLFEYRFGKTDLFYSPVIERFVYKELLGDGHQFVYRDQTGADYGREAFEALIPFIYYKNMELWGRLPLELQGQRFDKARIQAARQVLQLDPEELPEHRPRIQLFPLLESNPGRARLRFPTDIMRPNQQLTFINSDANRIDAGLTRTFTEAMTAAGFAFPVAATFGRVSILKPFDAGFFLLDAEDKLFHLKRVDDAPRVARVPLPAGLKVRHVKIAENRRGEYLGLVLAADDRLFLLGQQDYALTPLPLPRYDPDRMALKILFNPLYRTAVYSDQTHVHAVAMDQDFHPIDRYSREMAMARTRPVDQVWSALVPFSLALEDPNGRYLRLQPRLHGQTALIGIGLALPLAYWWLRRRGLRRRDLLPSLLLVAVTGLYGLLANLLFPPERAAPQLSPEAAKPRTAAAGPAASRGH
ncbi:DUF4857 domain-containing protein [uncultured Thiohalocapsa sp.]|uniref:DUF4857 domain-containing protein n=1 Tax=uncultured Thiohalocapsa sp. TaxID=768990 RepID=UPI0025EF2450|nr:DUF4857 domain-containing protein [uncultured Thiohalocapsa sp.]